MTYDAFLSYSSQDKAIANAMCHHLEQRGLRCWIAPRDVRPGEDYAAEIIDAIMASRALVVVFSANANASKHVKSEVERAVSHGTVVIPFRTEDVQPSKTLELFLAQSTGWMPCRRPWRRISKNWRTTSSSSPGRMFRPQVLSRRQRPHSRSPSASPCPGTVRGGSC